MGRVEFLLSLVGAALMGAITIACVYVIFRDFAAWPNDLWLRFVCAAAFAFLTVRGCSLLLRDASIRRDAMRVNE